MSYTQTRRHICGKSSDPRRGSTTTILSDWVSHSATHGMMPFLQYHTLLFIFTILRPHLKSLIPLRSARTTESRCFAHAPTHVCAYSSSVNPIKTDRSEKMFQMKVLDKNATHMSCSTHFYLKSYSGDNYSKANDRSKLFPIPVSPFIVNRAPAALGLCTHRSR
jgi:hypothetical protein